MKMSLNASTLLELILNFADEYQVQMFSGPLLEGSSDAEQCHNMDDTVCIAHPGDFYEHPIQKRSQILLMVQMNSIPLSL